MEKDEFMEAVREMRKWQKEYFRTRAPRALELSRQYEKKVDTMVEDALSPPLFK